MFGQDFEVQVKSSILLLMFRWGFEVAAWSRLWRWNLIKICLRTCDMTYRSYFGNQNSTLGSVVPLAMFKYDMRNQNDIKRTHCMSFASRNLYDSWQKAAQETYWSPTCQKIFFHLELEECRGKTLAPKSKGSRHGQHVENAPLQESVFNSYIRLFSWVIAHSW